jgi:hypothetical protein
MKRPCQALAGRRVVDHLMSVFHGGFARGPLARPGVAVPAGWVRAAAAGRAGNSNAGRSFTKPPTHSRPQTGSPWSAPYRVYCRLASLPPY